MAGTRRTVGLIAGLAVAVLAVAAFGGWWFLIRDDAPKKASIDAAGKTLADASSGSTTTAAGAAATDVNGTWQVDKSVGDFSDFSGTWAGYRVEEQLSGLGSNTAVGRTPDVTGTMTIEGNKVTGVNVNADLTSLQSDSGARDGALHSRGLQTDQFPQATFKLTDPIEVPTGVADGKKVSATAQGELTVHGVTKPVTVKIETTLQGGKAAVVGNAPIKLTDFNIEPPTGFRVLSIKNDGTFEFQIFFAKQ